MVYAERRDERGVKYDYLIVGAGFAGCIIAERLATQLGKKILLIDRRNHIAGNAFDGVDEQGIRIHSYGPHLFHTNDEGIINYLSQFTTWRPYEHRVLALVNGLLVPMPVNRTTVNTLFALQAATDDEMKTFYEREKESIPFIRNSEDVVLSKVGRRLFELLYKGYTTKHWGIEPSNLAASVCGRLPVRTNTDDRYFDDRFQMMPARGYTEMFRSMIAHPLISVEVDTQFGDIPSGTFDRLIFTGPIDEYFQYIFGPLPYRSLHFEFETHEKEYVQAVAQINYPNDFDYTRSVEFKHITGQHHSKTTIAKEYPREKGEPYYPIPNENNEALYKRYAAEAKKLKTVHFIGRLATYRYYNMDQVAAQALTTFTQLAQL
jgi:UDP-galactopyranose mutase